jgi:hypothetical protein
MNTWPAIRTTTPGSPYLLAGVLLPASDARDEQRDPLRTEHGTPRRALIRAAVGPGHHVGREHLEQPVEVTLERGREETVDEPPLLLGSRVEPHWSVGAEPFLGPVDDLSAGDLGPVDHPREA